MNNVSLLGRLTKDPELRYTQSGIATVRFTLAVDRRFKDQNGERGADFISIVAWRKAAEIIAQYARKGSQLAITGSIQTGSYDNQQTGQRVYTTDVVVDQFNFVGSRPDGVQAGQGNGFQAQNTQQQAPAFGQTNSQPSFQGYDASDTTNPFTNGPIDISDDDLPF